MICISCGKEYPAGTDPAGIPYGFTFELAEGVLIDICTSCVDMCAENKVLASLIAGKAMAKVLERETYE